MGSILTTAIAPDRSHLFYEMRCWGEFELIGPDGADETPRGRKARAILAYLACHAGAWVRRERLASLLWPDRGDQQARASLRQSLHEMRRLCEDTHPLLEVTREHARLNRERLRDSEDGIEEAAASADLKALAAAITPGDLVLFEDLSDVAEPFDEWLAAERIHRQAQLAATVTAAAETGLAQGKIGDVRALADLLETIDSFDEGGARLGMVADARASDGAACERRYHRLREVLARELNVQPSAETEALHLSLRQPVHPVVGALPPATPGAQPKDNRTSFFATAFRARATLIVVLLAIMLTAFAYSARPLSEPMGPISIAVVPFRNLSPNGNPHFAEGVSEEIMAALASSPRLRVLGRTSSAAFGGSTADPRLLGRRLGVDHLIEGTVQTAGQRVRVSVSLVRIADGVRLWSHRYDAQLGDIMKVQADIGVRVADRLSAGLVAAEAGRLPTRADVYALYITARGLLRDRKEAKAEAAADLLRRTLALDPTFAPAWSYLAVAVRIQTASALDSLPPGKREEAVRYARRALQLAPNLAETHGAYGAVIFQDDLEASRRHLERATILNPNSAEGWHWLSIIRERVGDYPGGLEAARRALALEPIWHRSVRFAADMAWYMGYRDEALGYVNRAAAAGKPFDRHMLHGGMALRRGDLSESVRHARIAMKVGQGDEKGAGGWLLSLELHRLGVLDQAEAVSPAGRYSSRLWQLWQGGVPPRVLERPFAEDRRISKIGLERYLALRLFVAQGRSREAAILYDRWFGSPQALARHPEGHFAFLSEAPVFAAALRKTGREDEASRILTRADAAARATLRRGPVPLWYHPACAQIWAAQGKTDAALVALEDSLAQGWVYAGDTALPDIAMEPGFERLRRHPRFERIRDRLRAHIQRERQEAGLNSGTTANEA